jgi:hypothetical protein
MTGRLRLASVDAKQALEQDRRRMVMEKQTEQAETQEHN